MGKYIPKSRPPGRPKTKKERPPVRKGLSTRGFLTEERVGYLKALIADMKRGLYSHANTSLTCATSIPIPCATTWTSIQATLSSPLKDCGTPQKLKRIKIVPWTS